MIFLDLDGVLADFDSHYETHFGVRPKRWPEPDTTKWKLVNSVPDFYRTIPLMTGARDLFRYVDEAGYGVAILTGVPSSVDAADNQKHEWAAEHFPHVQVICCPAREKWEHGRPGDFLIDDYLKYRLDWIGMGGVFIHHTDVPSTIAKLRELGICAMSLPEPSYGG